MTTWTHIKTNRINAIGKPLLFAAIGIAYLFSSAANADTSQTNTVTTEPTVFTFKPFKARYNVIKSGITIGHADFTLSSPSNNVWQYRSKITPIGIAKMFVSDQFFESSTVIKHNNNISPINYSFKRTGSKPESAKVSFNWQKKLATYGKEQKTTSITSKHVDRYTVILNVMRDAALDRKEAQYTIIEKNVRDYQYTRKETSKMNIPTAGKSSVIRIRQTNNSNREVHYWLSTSLNFVPAKIEQFKDGDSILRMELDDFSWL